MAGSSAVKIEAHPVSLKIVAAVVTQKDEKKLQLAEDLARMGCEGLLMEPWSLKSDAMVQEFQREYSNKWKNTIYRDLEHWTADSGAEVYSFRKEGRKRAGRIDKWIEGIFKTTINPKDRHAVVDSGLLYMMDMEENL